MDTFGKTQPQIVPLDLSENQFQIYNKISRNYSTSFLFESLTGPEILAETSVMGFDPKTIVKGYSDKVEVIRKDQDTEIIQTDEPYTELKKLLKKSDMQEYRYLGGAVGIVNYDAIRLVEKIPNTHNAPEPLMEFGIYDDGILYDNVHKNCFIFIMMKIGLRNLKYQMVNFESFNASEIIPNMDKEKFFQYCK